MKTTADQHKISQMNQIRSRDPILRLCLPLLCLKKIIKIIYIYICDGLSTVSLTTPHVRREGGCGGGVGGRVGTKEKRRMNEAEEREREGERKRERDRQTDRDIYKILEKMKLNGTEW